MVIFSGMLTSSSTDARIRGLLFTFAYFLIATTCTVADDKSILQASVETAVRKAVETTVRLEASGDSSSGVVISDSGRILTVNHGLPVGTQLVTVTDALQNRYKATVIQRDVQRDLAVLQVSGDHFPSSFAIAQFAELEIQQPLIASGFPAFDSAQASVLIRIGQVTRHTSQLVRTTCQLTAGDSGGGLFDLNGRLVGINQRIGKSRSANVHRKAEEAFRVFSFSQSLHTEVTNATSELPAPGVNKAWLQRTLQVFDHSASMPTASSETESPADPLCHAILWDSQRAITKLSEIGTRQQVLIRTLETATTHAAKVILKDFANDLAVLRFLEEQPFSDAPQTAETELHQLVATGIGFNEIAIIGRQDITVEPAKPILGCTLSARNGQIQIDSILPNSAAAKAKLEVSDVLIRLNSQAVNGFDTIATTLQGLQPGDWIAFEVRRGKQVVLCNVQLQHDPANLLERTAHLDGAVGAISLRRTGFRNVIQHDANLKPLDMGSPLLSFDGRLLGLNIAVRSREGVVAIPVETLKRILQ